MTRTIIDQIKATNEFQYYSYIRIDFARASGILDFNNLRSSIGHRILALIHIVDWKI